MLSRDNFLSLNFIKKEDFTGSYKGIRFLLRKETIDEVNKLRVYMWSEPLGFEATEDKNKLTELFDFSEQGMDQVVEWMNERYEQVRYKPKKEE